MQTILFILKWYTYTEINYHSSKLPQTFSMQLLKIACSDFTQSQPHKVNTFVTKHSGVQYYVKLYLNVKNVYLMS